MDHICKYVRRIESLTEMISEPDRDWRVDGESMFMGKRQLYDDLSFESHFSYAPSRDDLTEIVRLKAIQQAASPQSYFF